MTWPNRAFLDLVGTEHPIIQAPMANAGGVDLCVAAIAGGALGSLPCGMLSPEQAREQAGQVRVRAKAPLNLNFLCRAAPETADDSAWRALLKPYLDEFGLGDPPPAPSRTPFDDAACELVEALSPEVVSFHFGLPDESLLARVRAAGAKVISTATTVAEAQWLERRGVDAVIAQGFEAGGHNGRFLGDDPAEALTLLALLPQVVDAVRVPVIAAGGIGDSRGIAAAFTLGASAVQLGTAYLHCPESLLPHGHRMMLKVRPTVMTNLYSGGLARAVRGRFVDQLGPIRAEAPPYPVAGAVSVPLFRAAVERGEYDFMPSLAGQAAPLGLPLGAAELTRKLAGEALAILSRAA
ncbi:MAG TPA: nitronate monooxygenase [Sphingomicrobium sp.]|nr:nitronate monooxygenase [Sphingomicrobium sp.]